MFLYGFLNSYNSCLYVPRQRPAKLQRRRTHCPGSVHNSQCFERLSHSSQISTHASVIVAWRRGAPRLLAHPLHQPPWRPAKLRTATARRNRKRSWAGLRNQKPRRRPTRKRHHQRRPILIRRPVRVLASPVTAATCRLHRKLRVRYLLSQRRLRLLS